MAAFAAFCAGGPAAADQVWWTLARSTPDPAAILDVCRPNFGRFPSPASFYEGNKQLGYWAEISDKGDEVEVDVVFVGARMRAWYFRTREACREAARLNIDAAYAN
jgi:hypothetical protein